MKSNFQELIKKLSITGFFFFFTLNVFSYNLSTANGVVSTASGTIEKSRANQSANTSSCIECFVLSMKNIVQTAANKIEFDVYLQDTDLTDQFQWAGGQFGIWMNTLMFNGGTITVTYDNTNSGIKSAQQFNTNPNTATKLGTQTLLKLAGRTPPGAGNGSIIPTTSPGALITHFTITGSVNFLAGSTPDFAFANSTYPTVVAEYINNVTTVLTLIPGSPSTPGANAIVYSNQVLNGTPTISTISPTSGTTAGGTTVTITGTNFITPTAVKFGSTNATSYAVNSATQITAVAPAGTGTVDITVTTAGGTSATGSADQFTYVVPPTITSISPTSGTTAGGTTVTITGTNFTGATAVTFGTASATGVTVDSDTQITATAPSGIGTVDVAVTTADGKSATNSADQFTYVAPPTIPATNFSVNDIQDEQMTLNWTRGNGNKVLIIARSGSAVDESPFGSGLTANTEFGQGTKIGSENYVVYEGTANNVTITGLIPSLTYYFAIYEINTPSYSFSTALTGNASTPAGLSYCVPTATTDVSLGITSVLFNTINNTSTGIPAFSNYRSLKTIVEKGLSYDLSARINTVGNNLCKTKAWIDWNRSGTFDVPSEEYDLGTAKNVSNGLMSLSPLNIVIPATATLGITTMRIRTCFNSSPTPCGNNNYSEAEDYSLKIVRSSGAQPAVPTITSFSPTSGSTAGGTTVIITGTNLASTTAVNFGSTKASYTVNSDTQITASLPAGTGTVDITVTTDGGTSIILQTKQFEYYVAPTTISVVSTAGGLTAAITAAKGDLKTVANLTITGIIDATDFKAMRDNMPLLAVLDITGVNIAEYIGTGGTWGTTNQTYKANEFPMSAFYDSTGKISLTSVTFPTSITSIGALALNSCSGLTNILTIPDGVTSIEPLAFSGCSGLRGDLKIPSKVINIGNNAFAFCSSLTGSLTIPEGMTTIRQAAFYNCSGLNGTLTIPNGVTRIEHSAFEGCEGLIGSVTIPNTVTYIGDNILNRCAGLDGILTIGSGVTSIGQSAFSGCSHLTAINVLPITPVNLTNSVTVFNYINKVNCKLTVPTDSYSAYSTASQWSDFFSMTTPSPTSLSAFSTFTGTASESKTFTIKVSATMLNLIVTAPIGFEVRESNTGSFTKELTFVSGTEGISTKTIEVRIAATTAVGSPSGNVVCTSTGVTGQNVAVSGTVNVVPAPTITYITPTIGPLEGGTSVNITGTHLGGATAVNFGGVSATFTVNSSTSITAISPAGSVGVVDVTVTTNSGTSEIATYDKFRYEAAPTVTQISPKSGPIAGRTQVTINGTNLTYTAAVYFGDKQAVILDYIADRIIVRSPVGTAGTVDITVKTAVGISDINDAARFTYVAEPSITSISPTSGSSSGGKTVTITGTNLENATTVNFGSNEATIKETTANRITAISPVGSVGVVDVRVTTAGGTSAISTADQFTYFLAPTTISVVSTAGDLAAAIKEAGGNVNTVSNLTITGTINAKDFSYMRYSLPNLLVLDIKGTTIAAYSGLEGPVYGNITYPANEIPQYALTSKYMLTAIELPTTITSIGIYAFASCYGLTTIKLPTNITSIGAYAFLSCPNLTQRLTIPSSVTSIGIAAFASCYQLSSIYSCSSTPIDLSTSPSVFNDVNKNTCTLYVPTEKAKALYAGANQWRDFKKIESLAPTVTAVSPASCTSSSGGISVVITGTKFTGTTAVNFGTTAATFTVNSDTQITATAPAGTGMVDITVTNAYFSSETNILDQFRYAAAPTAITKASTDITATGATLKGTVNANNASTTVTFEYGLTTSYGSSATAAQSPISGINATEVSAALTNLTPNTTYHYRVKAVNAEGTVYGDDMTFTTSGPDITFSSLKTGNLQLYIEVPDNATFYIDWGNGALEKNTYKTYYYSTANYVAGNTVKIYGAGITRFDVILQAVTNLVLNQNNALLSLNCSNNQIGTLDVSKCTALTNLDCSNNRIEAIDLTKNIALSSFDCNKNQLTDLVIENNIALVNLICSENKLTALNITTNTALEKFWCWKNQLTELDVTKNVALFDFRCSSNKLTTLNILKNTSLFILFCNDNKLTALDVSQNSALSTLQIDVNKFDFRSLPQRKLNYSHYNYTPQATITASTTNGIVDLSSQLTAKDIDGINQKTSYTWRTKTTGDDLILGTDYTESNGVFTFLKSPADSISCYMTNAAFPEFLISGALKTRYLKFTAGPAIVNTTSVTEVTANTAKVNAGITDFGLDKPYEHGVVWSTTSNPTVALSTKTTRGAVTATGTYVSEITGLKPNTKYYVRAYATNNCTIGYGAELTFTTPCGIETLPYIQGFNDSALPSCWSRQYVNGTLDVEFLAEDAPEGTNYVSLNNTNSFSTTVTRIVSNPINTVGIRSVDVLFQMYQSWSVSNQTGISLEYSTDGINWISAGATLSAFSDSQSDWTRQSVRLPQATLNKSCVYIGFKLSSPFYNEVKMDDVQIVATTIKPEPTNQASNFAVGEVTSTRIPISWTAADAGTQAPDGYLIKLSENAVVNPADEVTPTNSTTLTNGEANITVPSNGSGSSNAINGLAPGTMYNYSIFSYTNTGAIIDFNLNSAPTLNHATLPESVNDANISLTNANTATIAWTLPASYNSANHSTLVFVKATNAINAASPSNLLTSYIANNSYGQGSVFEHDAAAFCVYKGDNSNVSISQLTANTSYYVIIYTVVDAANSNGTNSYSIASSTSYKIEPSSQVTNFTKNTVTSSAISLKWTAATGTQIPDGYLLKLSTEAIADPVDGTDPDDVTTITNNAANKKVMPGTATSATSFSGLKAGKMYNYKIYPYTNAGAETNYNLHAVPSLSQATLPAMVGSQTYTLTGTTTANITWAAAVTYDNSKHSTLVFVKRASAINAGTPTSAPSSYIANLVIGLGSVYQHDAAAYCVYKGDGSNVSISGLIENEAYYVSIFTVVDASNSDNTNSYSMPATIANGTASSNDVMDTNGKVFVVLSDDDYTYIGGEFSLIGGVERNNLARYNNTDGSLDTSWKPSTNGLVQTMAFNGDYLYIGGDFSKVDGLDRASLAKINKNNGTVDANWTPTTDRLVAKIVTQDNDVYIGGRFDEVNNKSVIGIVKLNTTNGAINENWNANADSYVYSIEIDGKYLYVGGAFTNIGGLARNAIARLSTANGNAEITWDPNLDPNWNNYLVYTSASTPTDIYIGGIFPSIGGVERSCVAKISKLDGSLNASWKPNIDGLVTSIILDGLDIYIGGGFSKIDGVSRNNIAKLKASNALIDTWSPNANNIVCSMSKVGDDIYVGGEFSAINGKSQQGFAKIPAPVYTYTISAPTATTIKLTTATLGATIAPAEAPVIDRGICWSTTAGVTIADHKTSAGGTTGGIFTVDVSDIENSTTIYYKGYVITQDNETILSNEASFSNVPVFTGTGTWEDATKWNVQELPLDALSSPVIDGICTIFKSPVDDLECNNLTINSGAKLTIHTDQTLVVRGTITNNAGAGGLVIRARPTAPNASFFYVAGNPSATVEMYSKASWDLTKPSGNRFNWQYFGIPVKTLAYSPDFDNSIVRRYNEAATDDANLWKIETADSILTSGTGYELTQETAKLYSFKGPLTNAHFTRTLPYTIGAKYPGQHIFGNPFTAAIEIQGITFGDNTEESVYLFNTGTYNDWEKDATSLGNAAGQYTVSTKLTAGNAGIPAQIPSMQGFLMKAMNEKQGSFAIEYGKGLTINTAMQRAPRNKVADEKVITRIDVTSTHSADRMWLFTEPTCTRNFDNGWDGYKMMGSAVNPQLFAMEADGNYQINAVPTINETYLGFQAGQDTDYTLKFTQLNVASAYNKLYLMDLEDGFITDITADGSEYSFKASSTPQPVKRFKIVTNVGLTTENAAVSGDKLNIFHSNEIVYVENRSDQKGKLTLYDLKGITIKIIPFDANKVSAFSTQNLIPGVYLAKAGNGKEEVTAKIIIR